MRGKISLRKERRNQSEIINASTIPTIGAMIMKLAVCRMLGLLLMLIAPNPPLAIAAPARPPINVCDEEEGMPNHQVNKFQMMDPISPERTTVSVIHSGFTVFATVFATPWSLKIKKAAKLNNAAQITAWK